ncbi:MAG: hypothetical protein GXP14_05775 [Gammaproteobacteria bacterium]|nr:hypothetical protein [Gammaproteobacteria bacterium]
MTIQRYIAGLLLALMSGSIWASVVEERIFNYDHANKQLTRILALDRVALTERERSVCSQEHAVNHAAYYFASPNQKSVPVAYSESFDVVLSLVVDAIILKQLMPSGHFNSTLPGPPAGPPPKHII